MQADIADPGEAGDLLTKDQQAVAARISQNLPHHLAGTGEAEHRFILNAPSGPLDNFGVVIPDKENIPSSADDPPESENSRL